MNKEADEFWTQMEQGNSSYGPARRKKRSRPEAKVQREIASWLMLRGVLVSITDAGVLAKMGLGMKCGIPKGWPDLTCCLPGGRFLGVECKAPKGRQSEEQVRMELSIQKRSGLYILARSVEELKAGLAAVGVSEINGQFC
jgi:hypothetical protein